MSSGKYRITKIKRKWDENEKKAVEKVTKLGKNYFMDGEKDLTKIVINKHFSLFSLENKKIKKFYFEYPRKDKDGNDIGSRDFIFKTDKLIESLKYYGENGKFKNSGRKAFPNEIDKLKKRLKFFDEFNGVLFKLCVDNLKETLTLAGFKASKINMSAIKDYKIEASSFKFAFINKKNEGLKIKEIFTRTIKENRGYDGEFFSNLFKEKSIDKDFDEYLEKNKNKIYEFLLNFINLDYEELVSKGNRERYESLNSGISKEEIRKELIKSRILSNEGTLSNQRMEFIKGDYEKTLEKSLKLYDVKILCESINMIKLKSKIEAKSDLYEIINCIKVHYKEVVVKNVKENLKLTDADKYALRVIHDYIKGRYRKFIDIINKESQSSHKIIRKNDVLKTFGICNNTIDTEKLISKIKRSLLNKVYNSCSLNGKVNYHLKRLKKNNTAIKFSSVDIEYIKAKETFFSKLGTAISMAGHTLNSNLKTNNMTDFLLSDKAFIEWEEKDEFKINKFNNEIIYKLFAQKNDEYRGGIKSDKNKKKNLIDNFQCNNEIQDFINYIYNIRLNVAHYKFEFSETWNNPNYKNSADSKMRKYIEKLPGEMKRIYIQSLDSNNVVNCYSEKNIRNFIDNLNFENNQNSLFYPSFDKVYKEIEKLANDFKLGVNFNELIQGLFKNKMSNDDKIIAKQQAFKFILQELYYNSFFKENLKIEPYKELYFDLKDKKEAKKDRITENFDEDIKVFKEILQREASIQNQITLMNQKWIRFITSQYIEFIKNHNWITDIMDYNSEIKIENEDEYSKSLKIKEVNINEMTNSFVAVATLVDRKEVSHIIHDIKKFIQFSDDLLKKNTNYNLDSQIIVTDYTEEIKKKLLEICYILEIIVKGKDRDSKELIESTNERYESKLKIIVEMKIGDAEFTHKEHHKKTNIFKDGNYFINIKSINRVEQYGTLQMLSSFFDTNKKYKFLKEDFKIIEEYYNKSGTLNDNYNNFLRKFHQEVKGKSKKEKADKAKEKSNDNSQEYKDAKNAHKKYIKYVYAQSKYKGEQLNRAHHFVMDVYGHFLAWITRWERDFKYTALSEKFLSDAKNIKGEGFESEKFTDEVLKQQQLSNMYKVFRGGLFPLLEKAKLEDMSLESRYEKNRLFRNEIVHFEYFIKQNKSLLDICNRFYELFSYNIKYQRDVQTVINNIFEKYGIVAYNIYDGKIKAKVLIYDYKDRKLKFSDYDNNKFIQIGAKSHVYFPEIKLIHENQVDMLRSLFEYKKS